MSAAKFCPNCGAALLSDSTHGVCPRCALNVALTPHGQGGIEPTISSGGGHRGPFTPPKAEELAHLFPQLEILGLIGHGGMGAVYKARQRGLDRFVALKILPPHSANDPAFAERFHREARALAKLNHPHIVSVHDSGQAGGLYYFLMEYVDGVNVRQAIQSGTIEPKAALAIVPQICDALQYAHDEGIVHRDIKPENILLDRKGRVKIADFGLARLLGKTADTFTLTATHQVMGTPRYMAPEQLEGSREVDHRADIYSLGVVFYEMLTRELPLGRFAPPSRKVQLDVRLDEVVLRTLEKEPELRYQQASEVKTAVEDITGALRVPRHMLRMYGYEYRSQRQWFGIPLVHIAYGIDPKTHRRRVAKGIVAIGDIAIGGFAMGGMSVGAISLGGVSAGLISIGGASLGLLLAFGGAAIGLGISLGGFAVGSVAIGGCAVGIYAMGGGAFGLHAVGGNANDPVGREFFHFWWPNLFKIMLVLSAIFPLLMVLGALLNVFQRRKLTAGSNDSSASWQPPEKPVMSASPSAIPEARSPSKYGSTLAAGCAIVGAMILLCGIPVSLVALVLGFAYFRLQGGDRAVIVEQQAAIAAADQAKAMQRELQSQSIDPEMRSGIQWTVEGPRLAPAVVDALDTGAPPAFDVASLNKTLDAIYREYLRLEQENHHRQDTGAKIEVTIHIPTEKIDSLNHDLWARLDSQLDLQRQTILRSKLRAIPVARQSLEVGGSVNEVVSPSILGWGSRETKIQIQRMGNWFDWTIASQDTGMGDSGRELPVELRRFLETPEKTPEAEKSVGAAAESGSESESESESEEGQ